MSLETVVRKDSRSFWSKLALCGASVLTALGLYDSVPSARSDEEPRNTPVFASPTQSVDDVLFEEPKLPAPLAPPIIQANPEKCAVNYTVVIDFENDPLLISRCRDMFFNIAKINKIIDFTNIDVINSLDNLMVLVKDKQALLDLAVNMDSMDGFADDCIRVSGLKNHIDAYVAASDVNEFTIRSQFCGGRGFFSFDLNKHPYAGEGNVTDLRIHSSRSTLIHTEKFTFSSDEDYGKFFSAIRNGRVSNGNALLLALDIGGDDREFSAQELVEFENAVKRSSKARRFIYYPARHIRSAIEGDDVFAEQDPIRRNFYKEFAYMDVEGVFVFVDGAGKESTAAYDKFVNFCLGTINRSRPDLSFQDYAKVRAYSFDVNDNLADGNISEATVDKFIAEWNLDMSKLKHPAAGSGSTRMTSTTSILFYSPKLRNDFAARVKAFSLSNSTVEYIFWAPTFKLKYPITESSKDLYADELKQLDDLSKKPGYKVAKSYGSILP